VKLALRHKIPAVVGTAVLLAGAGGAVAYAVSGHGPTSTDIGNTLPIDDNHRVDDRGTHVEPGEDRGGLVTRDARTEVGDDRGTQAEPGDDKGGRVTRDARTEVGDDRGTHVEPGDDRGGDATSPAPDASRSGPEDGSGHDGSGHDTGGDSGSGGHGSDD
jgi:hypothetical protein